MEGNNKKKKRAAAFIVAVVIFILLLALCVVFVCRNVFTKPVLPESTGTVTTAAADTEATTAGSSETAQESETVPAVPQKPENPIDFSKQMEINNEIYAWIRIPNTNVDYPVLQSNEDDLFYLRRDLNRYYWIPGSLFTQSINSLDFSDPVTVIYGHNMTEDGTMFATLHYFEDENFFRSNEYLYIYTPGHILTYRIISAYKYDTRHIMNSFDFKNEEVRRSYFDYVLNPMTFPMNVREGAELKIDDKLLILSTCMSTSAARYLVNSVLISDELTK